MKSKIVGSVAGLAVVGALGMFVCLTSAKANAANADSVIREEYIKYCESAGQEYNICPELLEAVIEQESGGDPDAVGQDGEIGLMQIYPKYHVERAARLGIQSLFDPKSNIWIGADYLSELFIEHEDAGTVLMVYNGVPDAIRRGNRGEYTEYAEMILKRSAELERLHGK